MMKMMIQEDEKEIEEAEKFP